MLKRIIPVILLTMTFFLTGCPQQQTLSVLVQVLGTASASIVALDGNIDQATKINADTAAAVAAIKNWKPGTPASDAIQVINILVADLNLIPAIGPYAPLIDLALGTAEAIITDLEGQSPPSAAAANARVQAQTVKPRAVYLSQPAKKKSDFKKQWNSIVDSNPAISKTIRIK